MSPAAADIANRDQQPPATTAAAATAAAAEPEPEPEIARPSLFSCSAFLTLAQDPAAVPPAEAAVKSSSSSALLPDLASR